MKPKPPRAMRVCVLQVAGTTYVIPPTTTHYALHSGNVPSWWREAPTTITESVTLQTGKVLANTQHTMRYEKHIGGKGRPKFWRLEPAPFNLQPLPPIEE